MIAISNSKIRITLLANSSMNSAELFVIARIICWKRLSRRHKPTGKVCCKLNKEADITDINSTKIEIYAKQTSDSL